ncbi:enolase C-terminal domain-like protein [Desertibaculum subflavum]|uniref:enolase C-terminal domain-like protein n=1 Tax=Desertibaculum subflavum TaxID=2268458 RepID=UPI000E67268A
MARPDAPVQGLTARAFRIPTDAPEADGTMAWDATTLIVVELQAGGVHGVGYTYASVGARDLVAEALAPAVAGLDCFDTPRAWWAMVGAVRNVGWRGVAASAISAVDAALWDAKAKLLGTPLARLLGMRRDVVPIYGSGGFTSYDDARLGDQLAGWVEGAGCGAVKMKVGSDPASDLQRVTSARSRIGSAELYVDANGALSRKRALAFAERYGELGVRWFEEPVSSDDLEGLRLLRDRGPGGMDIAAGEYGYELFYFRRMLESESVDVLQADASRCGGITGFLQAATLADAYSTPLSTHTAPALHLPVACAAAGLKNVEWFHDHVRIENMLFDGAPVPRGGTISPDLSRPGLGIEFKEGAAAQYAV